VVPWDIIESANHRERICTVDEAEPSRDLTQSDEIALKKVKKVALEYMQVIGRNAPRDALTLSAKLQLLFCVNLCLS